MTIMYPTEHEAARNTLVLGLSILGAFASAAFIVGLAADSENAQEARDQNARLSQFAAESRPQQFAVLGRGSVFVECKDIPTGGTYFLDTRDGFESYRNKVESNKCSAVVYGLQGSSFKMPLAPSQPQ